MKQLRVTLFTLLVLAIGIIIGHSSLAEDLQYANWRITYYNHEMPKRAHYAGEALEESTWFANAMMCETGILSYCRMRGDIKLPAVSLR